ncbi:MAG: hypothetical protein ACOYN0_10960 [Phycisphaerales bacterium]
MKTRACIALALCAGVASSASAVTVFRSIQDNGYFTPFNASTPSAVRYADSGWFGFGGDAPVGLESITLGMALGGSSRGGSTDLLFTFNDGDPAHIDFGSGAQLYSTTVRINLPDTSELGGPSFFNVSIPLPGVTTAGGFNNVGWSVGVSNFDSDGSLGFQCASAFGQPVGFYTNNAAFFNGASWSQFSFGGGAYGVANFVAEITSVPAPAAAFPLVAIAFAGRRRRA